ncbi:MFS transporter [Actinoplanes regularis]|uniref:Predicted arabinose efflux permease, MFS family n=1 Tax=Actinoplanes regularis TaxID=52697 RepID=A0A239F2C5_9ACTN|nr:MFS transporter [Actinoplanes regularis]GIE89941.1 putative MFS-type transporter YdeG [Actinoplanes regularis]SNS51150.1 Predicted arabinose efflux permease, MFS family [Actinoplanes regularis]
MTAIDYLDSPAAREALRRRTLRVVMASQVFSGAGLAAGVTVGTLLAADMLGTSSLSGLPVALFTAGSAGTALLIGRLSQRLGRRAGLTAGYAAGALGGAGVVLAAAVDSVVLLLLFLLVYGAGTATNLQARYAGADLAGPRRRGRAVSSVLVATTLGAVTGPNLVAATGDVARDLGIPALAGPFGLAAVAYGLAGTILFTLLRPDPLQASRRIAAAEPSDPAATGRQRTGVGKPSTGGVLAGTTTMVLTQLVMVAVMAMTPIHMRTHGHDLHATGLVIAIHIGGMYLPSPLTGLLVDRFGRIPVAAASGLTLLVAGVVAASAPTDSVTALALALALLGLGWNLGLVSGTAMVTDALPVQTRARTQGVVDLCVALAGAGGGIASGMILSATSYATLALGGGILALAVIPLIARRRPVDA